MIKFSLLVTLILSIVTNIILPQEYSWRYYRPGNTGIQGDQATALWIDENGDPYIAANTGIWGEGGFAKFSQSENKWINYSNVDYPILGSFDNGEEQIDEIIKDYENNLWMANNTGALKFNPQVGISSIEKFGPGNSGLLGSTTDIDLAPDSTIWFISGGMVRFNPKNQNWTYWQEGSARIAVQPKQDGSYLVWSADTYFGYVSTYNSATNQMSTYTPSAFGDIAGLPGKDCVDDAGNFWALRMANPGDWETLEYQKLDGSWVAPPPPYVNVSFYIDAFKAFGNGNALLVTTTGETWMFNGSTWQNYGTWRQGEFSLSVDIDGQGNVWVCGIEGAAKRDAQTGIWQRYRITNTSQIDYFVEDLSLDNQGNAWFTGNAGTGVGGFQKFDGERWTGFNEYTYGLGYPFPYPADNTQAIYGRPSNGDVVFNPTFNGIHAWNGINYFALEDSGSVSKGFVEDSQGRLWSLGEYFNVRYYDESIPDWITVPLTGWGLKITRDYTLPGAIWASTAFELLRTDGISSFSRTPSDFTGSAPSFTGLAVEDNGIVWIGTWQQFTSTGSTLIRLNANNGSYTVFQHDLGWPFPGEHVRPLAVTSDGRLWMMYDSEYPSNDNGLCWYDGVNVGSFPAPPGGVPQWGGLPNSSIKDLEVREISGGYELWMSCLGRGIAVLKVQYQPTISENQNNLPNDYSLLQNYPNPFNPATTISYAIPLQSFVSLKVYDILGNEVAVLVNEEKQAGNYEVRFDASNLSSGVYLYRLQVKDFTELKKMILLR